MACALQRWKFLRGILLEAFGGITASYVWPGVALATALATTMWAWRASLPGPVMVVIFLATFALVLFAINQIRVGERRRKHEHFLPLEEPQSKMRPIEFYHSRTTMLAVRHGLEGELLRVSRAWVSLIAGANFTSLSNEAIEKIEKLILVDPDSELIKALTRLPTYSAANLQFHIQAAIQRSRAHKVPLKISTVPPLILTIGDPETPQAWARIQIFMPHIPGSEQPNFVVYKAEQAKLFDTIKTHFEEMWERSRVAVELHTPFASPALAAPFPPPYAIESPASGIFLVQVLKSQLGWQENGGEVHPFLADEVIPTGAKRILRVSVRIEAPSLLVEEVRLAILGRSLLSDWMAMQLDSPREQNIAFEIPRSLAPGKHRARIVARSHEIERRSVLFEVEIPHVS